MSRCSLRSLILATVSLAPMAAMAAARTASLPTAGQVVSGSASLASRGATLTISQTSMTAIIDWGAFSIGSGATVSFDNGSGATLNEVTGGSASAIEGRLTGAGSVYLINANGVIFGKTGVVRTGGSFVASTLDPARGQFLKGGALTFAGTSQASVVNLGRIGSLGGDVTLIAATVRNQGEITARDGDAGLLAGYRVLVRDRALDDGRYAVLLGGKATSVTNAGVIAAANAELRARDGNVYALAGNTGGVIDATGVKAGDGHVWLVAAGGALNVGGGISAQGAGGAAGAIETSGQTVSLGKAAIDAHGGTWLLDPDDLEITAAAASTISTALATGNVTEETTATGVIDGSGQGVVTSGAGDITLDPGASIAWTSSHTLTLQAYNNLILNGAISLATGTLDLTAGGSLTVNAPISVTGAGAVDITAAAPSVSTPAGVQQNLQLSFAPGASVNYGPTDNGGTLTINGAPYKLFYSLADFVLAQGVPDMALATSFTASTAHPGAITAVPYSFTFEGLGNSITGLDLTNGAGGLFYYVAGMVRDLALIGGSVSGGTHENTAEGFLAPQNSGLIANVSVSGKVAGGATQAVGDLVGDNTGVIIDATASGAVTGVGKTLGGLAGTNEGTIEDSTASGDVSSTSGGNAGGLVGDNSGTIVGSQASGVVTGLDLAGGLVAMNSGTITASSASGAVDGSLDRSGVVVGGLAGENLGLIEQSDASGSVIGGAGGGLVGLNGSGAVISQSFATGAVNGEDVGGFADANAGTISDSYATGAVTGSGSESAAAGFASDNDGTISRAYATGVISNAEFIAGLVAFNDGGATLTDGYYDAGTTGQPLGTQSNGSVGMTTAQLQGRLPAGFSSSVWGNQPGLSYPYLLAFYGGGTPQAISGVASQTGAGGSIGAPIAGAGVEAVANGSTLLATTTTGANGYYYVLLPPGTLGSTDTLTAFLSSGPAQANAVATEVGGASFKGFNLDQNTLLVLTPDTSLTQTASDLAGALGSATPAADMLFTVTDGVLALGADDSLRMTSAGDGFDLDASLSLGTGLFDLVSAGAVTQTAGTLSAGVLQGSSLGGASFDQAGDEVARLAGWTDPSGAFSLVTASALEVGGAVSASAGVALAAGGDLTLTRGLVASAGDVSLEAGGTVAETAARGTITAGGDLTVTSVGGETLRSANHAASVSLANTGGGAVTYNDAAALTLAGARNGSDAVTLTSAGVMAIDGAVQAGTLKVVGAGVIAEHGAGVIDATTLTGSAGGTVTLEHANQIAVLRAFTDTARSFSLKDAQALTQAGPFDGAGQTVSLTSTVGDVRVQGTITADTLDLDARAGQLTQSNFIGAIDVSLLNATADTGILLTSTHNAIAAIGTRQTNSGPNQITQ